jgi:hypothetical protein
VQGRIIITRDNNGYPKFPPVTPGDDLARQVHAFLSALYGMFIYYSGGIT